MDTLYMTPFFAGLFLTAGFVLLFLEVFIPSGGILGIAAIACTAFGAFGFYEQGRPGVAITVVVAFCAYGAAMLYWILKRVSFTGAMTPDSSTSVDPELQDSLLGKEGITVTPLRPAGVARIDGKRLDVVSAGDFVERDVAVRVVEVSGNRVVVRKSEGRASS